MPMLQIFVLKTCFLEEDLITSARLNQSGLVKGQNELHKFICFLFLPACEKAHFSRLSLSWKHFSHQGVKQLIDTWLWHSVSESTIELEAVLLIEVVLVRPLSRTDPPPSLCPRVGGMRQSLWFARSIHLKGQNINSGAHGEVLWQSDVRRFPCWYLVVERNLRKFCVVSLS